MLRTGLWEFERGGDEVEEVGGVDFKGKVLAVDFEIAGGIGAIEDGEGNQGAGGLGEGVLGGSRGGWI